LVNEPRTATSRKIFSLVNSTSIEKIYHVDKESLFASMP
jgi:hypothetical protein